VRRFRRADPILRAAIHLLSYHFILKRRRTTLVRVAGFRLTVRPTVFHPRYFLTSKFFADFLSGIDFVGKRVADVGTGSGILALAAARAGAASVLALDINPIAAMAAAENARSNGLAKSIMAVSSNLLAALTPRPLFDVILSSSLVWGGTARCSRPGLARRTQLQGYSNVVHSGSGKARIRRLHVRALLD
jgi:release factor glutamine methyltransferase